MNRSGFAIAGLAAILLSTPPAAAGPASRDRKVYAEDVQFALDQLEKEAGHFFKLKKIDWRRVRKQFLTEVRKVKTDQDHLVLLCRLMARLRDGHASVRPLDEGKNIRPPAEFTIERHAPGMFWCRVGKRVFVKNSWGAAEKAGLRPGMEILQIDRKPVGKWLEARVEKYRDLIGFSTDAQAWFYTLHWGLSDKPGTKLTVVLRDHKRKKKGTILSYAKGRQVPWGPAFFPEGIRREGDLNYAKTEKGWGYIHVRRCPGELPQQMDRVLRSLGNVPGLILDFRGNSGGGFDHDAFLGRFIPKGKQIAFGKRYRSAGDNPYGGPIVVIIDATVRSAGETAAGIFKEDGRAYMIGESTTAGMSASKKTIELPSGLFSLYFAVYSNKKRFNRGEGIEGVGVIPHEVVSFHPKHLVAERDTLILYAEKLLAKFPQKKVPYNPAKFGWRPR